MASAASEPHSLPARKARHSALRWTTSWMVMA
jgi:hypothetical protein